MALGRPTISFFVSDLDLRGRRRPPVGGPRIADLEHIPDGELIRGLFGDGHAPDPADEETPEEGEGDTA